MSRNFEWITLVLNNKNSVGGISERAWAETIELWYEVEKVRLVYLMFIVTELYS